MAFYSDSNVKTRILDPKIYVPNARCTFELDASEAAYLPNLRLANIGTTSAANDYNTLLGSAALIRSIRLLDGKQELSALNAAQFYRGFQNINNTNSENNAVQSNLACNSLGLSILGTDREIDRVAVTYGSNTTTANTNSAFIDLKQMLPFLNAMSHLPTAVFQNLRLEVEFAANPADQILADTANALTTLRPILIVDVLENPKVVNALNKSLNAVAWSEVEHDQFVIPQSANDGGGPDQGITQNTNVKLNGFNNKILDRLLIVKEISDPAKELAGGTTVQGYGKYASQACYNQKLQLRINGSNIFPRQGIVGNNERLGYIVDTWGDCSAFPGSNVYGMDTGPIMQNGDRHRGQADYMGAYIGQSIQDLQVEYSRVGLTDGGLKKATTSTLIAHCYGEVRKTWQLIGNGQYNIAYAQ